MASLKKYSAAALLGILAAAFVIVPAMARSDDWALHQPSTPQERAQTQALNRQALAASMRQNGAPASNRRNATAAVSNRRNAAAPASRAFDRQQAQYQRELGQYRQAVRKYDRQMHVHTAMRQHRDRHMARQQQTRHVRHRSPPPDRHAAARRPDDSGRAAPWHGYNSHDGLGNGY